MYSRPLLKNTDKIVVLIDSKTFDDLLNQNDTVANAILMHNVSGTLDIIRNPFKTNFDQLKNIIEYKLEHKDSEISSIRINKEGTMMNPGYKLEMGFGYRIEDITSIAKTVYEKNDINAEELEKIISVFIQAVFNRFEKSNIYVTNDDFLLKNRLWFESHFPGCSLNIMSVKEASCFLDLFFKSNKKYYMSGGYQVNKGLWYWLSMRSKLPHYSVGDKMIDALANRLYYSLMALDEMGVQYYLGVNNDTMDNTLYHFSYLIMLMTGIFDNLAIKTDRHLGINFTYTSQISLNKNNGIKFLKEIGKKDASIRKHITCYVHFIKLIYLFRENVVHREGLPNSGFEGRSDDGEWKANFIKVNEKIKERLIMCGDENSKHDPFTKWGFYQIDNEHMFLNPFMFSLEALKKLTAFVDKYLELLGFQKYKNEDFEKQLKFFEERHLGF